MGQSDVRGDEDRRQHRQGDLRCADRYHVLRAGCCTTRRSTPIWASKVPTSWAEFRANNEKIKAAGKVTPISPELCFSVYLDGAAVRARGLRRRSSAGPSFAENYTAGKAKYVDQPGTAGLRQPAAGPRRRLVSTRITRRRRWTAAMKAIANGTAAHYPMLTGALSTIARDYPDKLNDVGFFALPAQGAANTGPRSGCPTRSTYPRRRRVPSSTPRRSSSPGSTRSAGCAVQNKVVFGCRTVCDQFLHAAGQRAAGREGPGRVPEGQQGWPCSGIHLPDQGPEPLADHGRGRIGHQYRQQGAASLNADVKKQAQQPGLPGW